MKKILTTAFLLFLAAFFINILADTIKLGSNGILHRIEVINLDGSTESAPRTYLLHTLQKPDGTVEKYVIPQTSDYAADLEPQLDLNPGSQQPAIVWSRFDGTDFEIALSVFDGTRWLPSKMLTSNLNNDREPKIVIENPRYMHLMWKEETPAIPIFYHLNICSAADSFGASEILYAPTDNLVLPDGTTPSTSSYPNEQSTFFAFNVPTPGLKRFVVWGGRDDPSPITFQEGFKLLDTMQNISMLKAEKINGILLVMFRSEDKFYYTHRTTSGWTPYRMIKIDSTTSEGKAELLIEEMIGNLSQ